MTQMGRSTPNRASPTGLIGTNVRELQRIRTRYSIGIFTASRRAHCLASS